MVGAGLFAGEIEPRTCCVAAVKLRGDSCTVVDGSGASDWPKSTFAVLVLPRGGRCRGVRDIVTVHEQTESSCASVYRANDFKSIHALRQNINTVAMLTSDALLRHFSKGMYHAGNRRLHTLISYVLLVIVTRCCFTLLISIHHCSWYIHAHKVNLLFCFLGFLASQEALLFTELPQ